MDIPQSYHELINRWYKRLREIQFSQNEAAESLRTRNYWLGGPVLVLNVIVSSAIFLSIKTDMGDTGKLIFGFVSLLATMLVGFQTFLKFNERAEKHQSAASGAAILRRKVEQLIAKGPAYEITDAELDKIREDYDKITREAPNVPESIWLKTEEKLSTQ